MNKLVSYYRAADAHTLKCGREWYADSLEIVREFTAAYNVSAETAAGVIAALSPRQTWATNLRMARLCLGGHMPRGLGDAVRKACAIRDGGDPSTVLRGEKVRAFYRAILGDTEAIVLDVWMLRALDFEGASPTPKQYAALSERVRNAAALVGESPAHFQAIVWCQIRGKSF